MPRKLREVFPDLPTGSGSGLVHEGLADVSAAVGRSLDTSDQLVIELDVKHSTEGRYRSPHGAMFSSTS